jgi:thiamine kinase-like enzyme
MEERFSLEALSRLVVEYFLRRARQYRLNPQKITASYILNWGGFVNASFTIGDGETQYHLKLADDVEVIEQLLQWQELHQPLEENYRAPRMLDWIEIEEAGFEGPMFEHFPGKTADFLANPALFEEVMSLLTRLHDDAALAKRLAELENPIGTCADYFISTYIDRFDEDLLIVVRNLPQFVSLDTLNWMQAETRHLEGLVRETPAFSLLADAPTHGDLWPNNVLVSESGDWRIIDWDDLGFGDPALEYSILISKIWRTDPQKDLSGASLLPPIVPADEAFLTRLAICLRAYVLDMVIDTLADYVESDFAPEFQDVVKQEKQREHQEALALYQKLYP